MARPLAGTTKRVNVTIRLEPDLIALLNLEAQRLGVTRTRLIEQKLAGQPTEPPQQKRKAKPPVVQGETKAAVIADLKAAITCPHPRTQRAVHSWGTTCGTCQQRL